MLSIRVFKSESLLPKNLDKPPEIFYTVKDAVTYCSSLETNYVILEIRYYNAVTKLVVSKELFTEMLEFAINRGIKNVKELFYQRYSLRA